MYPAYCTFAVDPEARSVENAIAPALLGQYFRSFMSRLTMLEVQLGVMPTTGNSLCPSSLFWTHNPLDDLSFTIVLELNDDNQPSAPEGKVSKLELKVLSSFTLSKDPPPWVPAVASHTTSATSDSAETHLVRAVNTGIIDVSSHFSRFPRNPHSNLQQVALVVQESEVKLRLLEQEQATARTRQREVEKGKGRML